MRALLLGLSLLLDSCVAPAAAEAIGCEPPRHCHTGCECTGNYGPCGRQDGTDGKMQDCKCTCGHGGRWCRAD